MTMHRFPKVGSFGLIPFFIGLLRFWMDPTTPSCDGAVGSFSLMDTIPPIAICKDPQVVNLDASGQRTLSAIAFDDNSYDLASPFVWYRVRRVQSGACGSDLLLRPNITFCCEEAGDTISVVLRVYDVPIPDTLAVDATFEVANSTDCTTKVYLRDPIKPVISTLPNMTVSCQTYAQNLIPVPTASDNCSIDTIRHFDQLLSYDTFCNSGSLRRRFTAFDEVGNTATSTMNLQVIHEQDYYVAFPSDTVLANCSEWSGVTNRPVLYNADCERMVVTYTDQWVPDSIRPNGACLVIKRTWRLYNQCTYNSSQPFTHVPNPRPEANPNHPANRVGVVVAPSGSTPAASRLKVRPTDPDSTDFSQFWTQNSNGFEYTQLIHLLDPTPPVVVGVGSSNICDVSANSPQLWAGPSWYEPATMLNDLREAPVTPILRVTDACVGDEVTAYFELQLDLDGNDTIETSVKSFGSPSPGTIEYNNLLDPPFGTPLVFDVRNISIAQKYVFSIQRDFVGDTARFLARWNTLANPTQFAPLQLPHGRHRIIWTVADRCGNTTTHIQRFSVSNDCQEPTIACDNAITVTLPSTGGDSIIVTADDIVVAAVDNFTTAEFLQYGIKAPPYPDVFPETPQGAAIDQLELDCDDIGFRSVRIWVRDLVGNFTTCDALITVEDPEGRCIDPEAAVYGRVQTIDNEPLAHVKLRLFQSPLMTPIDSVINNEESAIYYFNDLPPYNNYSVEPSRPNDDLTNGVSTFDLLLISRHILNLEPFNSPYKYLAADANRTNTITSFDIVLIRRAILGDLTAFPNNNSWRFVPKYFNFPDPANPLLIPAPERMILAGLSTLRDSADFIGIKVGDVDLNADPALNAPNLDERDTRPVAVQLSCSVEMSQSRSAAPVALFATATRPVYGLQFELQLADNQTITDEFKPVALQPDQYRFDTELHTLRVSYDAVINPSDGPVLLGYIPADWSKTGSITTDSRFRTAAYGTDGEAYPIEWVVPAQPINLSEGPVWLPNQPNPFKGATTLRYWMPVEGSASVRIMDASGRLRFEQQQTQALAGQHDVQWQAPAAGIYYCHLTTPQGTAVRTILAME
jgi:hypothetical protein